MGRGSPRSSSSKALPGPACKAVPGSIMVHCWCSVMGSLATTVTVLFDGSGPCTRMNEDVRRTKPGSAPAGCEPVPRRPVMYHSGLVSG